MTFHELFEALGRHITDHPDDEAIDRGVLVRIETEDGDDLHVGGLRSISVDAGCTEEPMLTLDADQEPP